MTPGRIWVDAADVTSLGRWMRALASDVETKTQTALTFRENGIVNVSLRLSDETWLGRLLQPWSVALGLLLSASPVFAAPTTAEMLQAARAGEVRKMAALLEDGADVAAANGSGRTALMIAAYFGNFEVVRMLIAEGADVNTTDKSGSTALLDAAASGHLTVATTLIRRGADINAQNQAGRSSLMEAAAGGNHELVALLVRRGADVNLVDRNNNNALGEAMGGEYKKTIELLQKAGAEEPASN